MGEALQANEAPSVVEVVTDPRSTAFFCTNQKQEFVYPTCPSNWPYRTSNLQVEHRLAVGQLPQRASLRVNDLRRQRRPRAGSHPDDV